MIRRLKTYLKLALLLLAVAGSADMSAASRGWEIAKSERPDAKVVVRETDVEIRVANGLIIVTTNHAVPIKVFTILGRVVNSETLPAGRSQLALPAHGVYIVRIGDLTCKVAV